MVDIIIIKRTTRTRLFFCSFTWLTKTNSIRLYKIVNYTRYVDVTFIFEHQTKNKNQNIVTTDLRHFYRKHNHTV